MAIYTITETFTLVFEIEASTPDEAATRYHGTSVRDFDHVDCAPHARGSAPRLLEIDGVPVYGRDQRIRPFTEAPKA